MKYDKCVCGHVMCDGYKPFVLLHQNVEQSERNRLLNSLILEK